MSATVDIAVVGAGIVGCMTARELALRRPDASIAVLDQDVVGSGASLRSAGLHFPRGATPRVRRMADYSQSFYESLGATLPGIPVHPLDMYVVAPRDAGPRLRKAYLDRAALHSVDGVPGSPARIAPGNAVWRGSGCQYADVHSLTRMIARELRPRVEFREAVRVTAIRPGPGADDPVLLELGTGQTLRAGRVVLAPGPWLADPAWSALIEPMGLRVKRVVALHVERTPEASDGAVVFQDADAFLLPLHDRGHWLFSYTCEEWGETPDSVRGGLRARDLNAAREHLRSMAPELAGLVRSGRVFCDAYSPDGEPRVRALEGTGRVVFAGAANGSGYRLAPAIAAEVSDLLNQPIAQGSPV